MISTRSNHTFVPPMLFDALVSNNAASKRLLVLAQYCNAVAAQAAVTPLIFNMDIVKIMMDLQDEILEANAEVSRTHDHIASTMNN